LVTEFKVGLENKLSLKKKDIENGVYVYLGENSPFPNVKKMIEEILLEKGFKVSDSLENSSLSLVFSFDGSLDIARADKQAANSNLPNGGQVATHVGALANSVWGCSRLALNTSPLLQ
jgi:hypothetical protein